MRNKLLLISLVVLFSPNCFSQETGYYGKRFFVEIDGQGQIPVLNFLFGEKQGYFHRNNEMKKSFNLVDIAYRASINYATNKATSFGIEFSQRFYHFNSTSRDEISRDYRDQYGFMISEFQSAKVAYFSVRETNFMPRVLVSLNDSQIPCGFASEIGIGYSLIQLPQNSFEIELPTEQAHLADGILSKMLDPRAAKFDGMNFMFGVRMNFPLGKHFLYHLGFRYQYALLFQKKKYRGMNESEYWFAPREVWTNLNDRRQLGVMSFGTGITFTF